MGQSRLVHVRQKAYDAFPLESKTSYHPFFVSLHVTSHKPNAGTKTSARGTEKPESRATVRNAPLVYFVRLQLATAFLFSQGPESRVPDLDSLGPPANYPFV